MTLFILRYGELFLKGGNRPFFERCLVDQVKRVVRPLGGRVTRLHGRVEVEVPDERARDARQRLAYVFGLTSFSRVTPVKPELDALCEAAVIEAEAALKAWTGEAPRTFKVETRRSDKRFPMKSPDISREVGYAVGQAVDLPADLSHPDLRVEVEIGSQRTFVTTARDRGPGGLPVGSAGKVQLLLSGGIDSPVAGYSLLKRGCTLLPTTFESPPYTGEDAREKVIDLCAELARYAGPIRLRIMRFTEVQLEIQRRCPARMAVVLYRRMMLRAAERAARSEGALALATGDSLAQVASQTLENLACIAEVATLPILRPLVTFDKAETIRLARRIGTFDISVRPHVDCCSLFVPDHPEIYAKSEVAQKAEALLGDVDEMAQEMFDASEVVEIPDPFAEEGEGRP